MDGVGRCERDGRSAAALQRGRGACGNRPTAPEFGVVRALEVSARKQLRRCRALCRSLLRLLVAAGLVLVILRGALEQRVVESSGVGLLDPGVTVGPLGLEHEE